MVKQTKQSKASERAHSADEARADWLATDEEPTQVRPRAKPGDVVALEDAKLFGDERIATPYGVVQLEHSFITDESSANLFRGMDLQRASQGYLWSTPIVSFYTFKKEQERVYGTREMGEFAVFDSLAEKRGIVTANLTTPYVIGWYDLSKGPLRIEYPAGATASGVLDLWQRPVTDMGQTGPDQAKGGTFVIVGPNDDVSKYEQPGVFAFPSATNTIFIGVRLLDRSPEFAERFERELKLIPAGGEPQPAVFKKNVNKEWSATAPRGMDYWKTLHEILRKEPVREQDKVWMAMLEPLGLMDAKFSPDERQTSILLEGAALGELMARNLQINPRYARVYWEGTHWYKSFAFQPEQATAEKVELDERTTWFYEAVTSSKGMINPPPGRGQVYMTTKRDRQGRLLRADKTYRLRVPKNVPVAQFWSVTLYSENTRRPYDNGGTELSAVTLSGYDQALRRNSDGSVDIYIGPKAPAGTESNHMKTVGQDGWFVYFRLYGPTQAFFDKSFSLPDFEVVEVD